MYTYLLWSPLNMSSRQEIRQENLRRIFQSNRQQLSSDESCLQNHILGKKKKKGGKKTAMGIEFRNFRITTSNLYQYNYLK